MTIYLTAMTAAGFERDLGWVEPDGDYLKISDTNTPGVTFDRDERTVVVDLEAIPAEMRYLRIRVSGA